MWTLESVKPCLCSVKYISCVWRTHTSPVLCGELQIRLKGRHTWDWQWFSSTEFADIHISVNLSSLLSREKPYNAWWHLSPTLLLPWSEHTQTHKQLKSMCLPLLPKAKYLDNASIMHEAPQTQSRWWDTESSPWASPTLQTRGFQSFPGKHRPTARFLTITHRLE